MSYFLFCFFLFLLPPRLFCVCILCFVRLDLSVFAHLPQPLSCLQLAPLVSNHPSDLTPLCMHLPSPTAASCCLTISCHLLLTWLCFYWLSSYLPSRALGIRAGLVNWQQRWSPARETRRLVSSCKSNLESFPISPINAALCTYLICSDWSGLGGKRSKVTLHYLIACLLSSSLPRCPFGPFVA